MNTLRLVFTLLLIFTGTAFAQEKRSVVLVGGVAGIESLIDGSASQKYRLAGGGLYLHNSGWARLSREQQKQVIANFAGHPIGIELGYGIRNAAQAWANRCKTHYLDLGIRPTFIAVNAFMRNNLPTIEGWRIYSAALRRRGLPESTLILPTFEYANFRPNMETLSKNVVSSRKDFQDIISTAGGIVLDSPPGFFFGREEDYRMWILDAIHWTHAKGLKVVWIASPHTSGYRFEEDTERCLNYFKSKNAMPDVIVSENYAANPKPGYVNVVGREDMPDTALGVGWDLVNRIIPGLGASPSVDKQMLPKPENGNKRSTF
jgi:hypothetical protein